MNMKEKKSAFGLVELLIVVMWLGIFAAIAVPRLNFAAISKQQAETIAWKIVTDLRLTRRLAISDAATNSKGFDLNMLGEGPYTGFEIENADTKAIVVTHTIDPDVSVTGDGKFKFTPLGNLQTGGVLQLTVSAEGKSFTITVFPATGTVKCTEN
jgi:type II secretory pathway pseudopilin PulG